MCVQILGGGKLSKALVVKAGAFSESAKKAITDAGGKAELLAGRRKWTKKYHKALVKSMVAKGLDYHTERVSRGSCDCWQAGQS